MLKQGDKKASFNSNEDIAKHCLSKRQAKAMCKWEKDEAQTGYLRPIWIRQVLSKLFYDRGYINIILID